MAMPPYSRLYPTDTQEPLDGLPNHHLPMGTEIDDVPCERLLRNLTIFL